MMITFKIIQSYRAGQNIRNARQEISSALENEGGRDCFSVLRTIQFDYVERCCKINRSNVIEIRFNTKTVSLGFAFSNMIFAVLEKVRICPALQPSDQVPSCISDAAERLKIR